MKTREEYERSTARFPGWYAVSFDPPRASRRAVALSQAAARRELWRGHRVMSTPSLLRELRLHEYHLSDHCRMYRPESLCAVSLWYVRMIRNELVQRGVSFMLSPDLEGGKAASER
jgi:hypothetical protein